MKPSSRPARAILVPLVLGHLVGWGIAALLPRPEGPMPATAASASIAGPPPPEVARPPVEAPPESATAPSSPSDVALASAETRAAAAAQPVWQMLAQVGGSRGPADRWTKVPVLRAKGPPAPKSPLNPEFAEFFGLGEAEQAGIEAGLDAVIAAQADLDLQAARVIPLDPATGFLGTYEQAFVVDPYPEQGAALHDRVNRLLRDTLGEERMAVYSRWAQSSLLADWQGVGLSARTIHVKRQNAGTPYTRWDINYEAKAPDGTRQQFNSMGNSIAEAGQQANFPLGRWLEAHPLPDVPAVKAR